MPTQYFLPVIHPAFELLKRSARMLHFIAASIILINGLRLLQAHEVSKMLCYLQLFIAGEIFFVLLMGKFLLVDSPGLNVFFRIMEGITLFGIGLSWLSDGYYLLASLHLVVGAGYFFLFYREWRILHSESINIRQTGILIPNFIRDEEIGWTEIKTIVPRYHSIIIETFRHKKIQFQLSKNLKIEELQQIDEFCRQHLAAGAYE